MVRIEKELCNGCRTCVEVCPPGVLAMNGKAAFVDRPDACIECGACSLNCSTGAVTVKKGTGCLLVILKEDILGMKEQPSCGCG